MTKNLSTKIAFIICSALTVIMILSSCTSASATSYTYDFWVPYKDFENAIENDLTLSASYEPSFTAEVKKIFGDIFIPFETVFPNQDPDNYEVQIFPDYGRYRVIYFTGSEDDTIITFEHSYLNYSDYPGGSTPKLSSKKVEVYSFDALKKHKRIHTEGISNSVPYLRQYTIEKDIDLTEYNITHTLYIIYGNSLYTVNHCQENAQLDKKEVMLLSDTDAYIDRLTSYIHDMHKDSPSTVTYDESKSFKKIYNETVKELNKLLDSYASDSNWNASALVTKLNESAHSTPWAWILGAAAALLTVASVWYIKAKKGKRNKKEEAKHETKTHEN